ncbi:MAG TPA: ABC transporter permease [Candidatus Saccharimonadales bacterium]|nr:ABC transporter permease [Candidatus Saccharimonadales bacterium]
MSRWNAFVQLFLARIREFFREPEVVFWVFGFPLILAVGLGVAFRNRPPDEVRIGVVNQAGAGEMARSLEAGGTLHVVRLEASEVERTLRLGKVALVVVPGPEAGDACELKFDPSRPESLLARQEAGAAIQRAAGRTDPVRITETHVTEPGARYIDFLIPGLMGMNIMSGGMWGVGFVLVEMRTRGLLKRLVATPMRRADFLAAMMASRMTLVFIEMVLLLGFGWLAFRMVIAGSLGTILLLALLGAFVFTGLGLLAASRARKIETISGLINLIMLPMFVFSGIFFSSDRFPDAAQPFIKALPLTALNDAFRATILEGAGLVSQTGRVAILLAWGALAFYFALRRFRWS